MSVLGALNPYGLVEVTAKGQTRVTQLAEDIFIGFPEEVKRQAVSAAGRSPTLFREIYDKYDGVVPGENAIRSFLFQRGFTNEGVDKALKSFEATNRYVEIYGDSESYRPAPESGPDSAPEIDWETAIVEPAVATAAAPPSKGGINFFEGGPLDFNLSSSGLKVTGKTNSASELRTFIEKLTTLAGLLPDKPSDGPNDEEE
jgi:hypothetical protein